MDPLLAAQRLPGHAVRAMRAAVLHGLESRRMMPRTLIDAALVLFERAVRADAGEACRSALLVRERDRIVRELRAFIESRFAARLGALRRRDVLLLGSRAAPFDAVVRNRRGEAYALIFRRLPADGRRLERLRRIRVLAERYEKTPLRGVVVFDFCSGSARLVRDSRKALAA